MAEASLLTIAESLLGKLSSRAFVEIKACWQANEDLQKLIDTIETIRAGLLDAESRHDTRQPHSKLVIERLRRLKNVLYDADDLFDEVFTAEAISKSLTGKERVVEELHSFFSKSNPIVLTARIAGKIKKIRREMDGIIKDMELFKLDRRSPYQTMSCRAIDERETVSIPADEVIGREEDVSMILGRLLNLESEEEDFPDVISIVGIGGLGKTSLAQLLFNNEDVKANFELRAWACISDIKQTKQKAEIVLKALGIGESINSRMLEELRLKVGYMIANQRYLLVLDDFWDDDLQRWMDLRIMLKGGKRGSKIVVTTRSLKVAQVMGVDPHVISGLADDKAQELFGKWAFRSAAGVENKDRLMEMGSVIVQKCLNVPLAIKAVASLLNYHHGDEKQWKSVMESELSMLDENQNLNILPVLKLSYDHLPSHLKPCFAFCSLFPKDFEMSGSMLVEYWIAQGYVEEHCSDKGQSRLLETGESYLKELAARSLLQPSYKGLIYTMHDLMHDLAQVVAGEEIFVAYLGNVETRKCNHTSKDVRIRHMNSISVQVDDDLLNGKRLKYLRSFIQIYYLKDGFPPHRISYALLKKLSTGFNSLRLLVLRHVGLEWLPSSVGELKLLRHLNISINRFKHLPNELTKLHNLRVMDVSHCHMLETLPDNLNRLINLKCLSVSGCDVLRGMVRKIGEISSLESLDELMITDKNSGLEAVTKLGNLRGKLSVAYGSRSHGCIREEEEEEKRVDLSSLVHLDKVYLDWPASISDYWGEGFEFVCSKLPCNLKGLRIWNFPGQKLPEWKEGFNNLMSLKLFNCSACRYLPSFGHCPRLRSLYLNSLENLEYVQLEAEEFVDETHFPHLEHLTLFNLPMLKAWTPEMEKWGLQHQHISSSAATASFPRFQSLNRLLIDGCRELMLMPLPPLGEDHDIHVDGLIRKPLRTLICAEDIVI